MSNSPQESSLAGTILHNRYKIIKDLGKGGFGHTFLAEDTQMPVTELCVVKQLNPPSFEPQMVEKCRDLFKQEALALQKLGKNPFIPELKAYFTDEEHFYLVQEYIKGKTLDQVMLDPTESDIIKIIEDVGNALVEVHQNNKIHRDIKPDNLILRDSDHKIVLIDFGAVKEITTQILNEEGQVIKTVVIGTNGYIAPEQAQGQPCCASDIYSLGIVAIEKLTRKKPVTFNFDEHGNVSWIADLPVGVSVSDGLAKILNKMTRFSLRERYNNIQQVLADLKTIPSQQATNVLSNFAENSHQNIVNPNFTDNLSNISESQPTQIKNQPSPIKKILFTLLSIILLSGIGFTVYNSLNSNSSNLPIKGSKWQTHQDTKNNFEFAYPQDWEFSQDPFTGDINILYSENEKIYDLVVSVDSLQQDVSLDQYSVLLASDISHQEPISTPVTLSDRQIANGEGKEIVYSVKDGDSEKQVQISFTKADQKVYIFKVTTSNINNLQEEKITNEIINSFKINN